MTLALLTDKTNEISAPIITQNTALIDRVTNILLKNVAEGSQRIYRYDAIQFGNWLRDWGLSIETIGYEDLIDYRVELSKLYKNKTTADRKLVVMRRLLEIAVTLKLRTDNPGQQVKGFNSDLSESPRRALTKVEARTLLTSIDVTTLRGTRDYALLSLLLRTGIRRAEAAALVLSDFSTQQGHHIVTIQHGKGDKRRTVKLPVDVMRAISDYLEATGRKQAGAAAPLFISFHRGDHLTKPEQSLAGADVDRIVRAHAKATGLEGLTPHGLRASFVTLTLEGGAKLEQVQYAAGHADPRTTERYQRRKLNLDDNAVDYLKL